MQTIIIHCNVNVLRNLGKEGIWDPSPVDRKDRGVPQASSGIESGQPGNGIESNLGEAGF